MNAQNELPLANAALETIDSQTNSFDFWSNFQTNGGQANYSIESEDLIPGSSKAQKSEILSLGTKGWHVKTHSDYLFQVEAGETYTVRYWAKANSASAALKVVFQSEVSGSYQGVNQSLTQQWQQYTHSFTVVDSAELNRLSFWYIS